MYQFLINLQLKHFVKRFIFVWTNSWIPVTLHVLLHTCYIILSKCYVILSCTLDKKRQLQQDIAQNCFRFHVFRAYTNGSEPW